MKFQLLQKSEIVATIEPDDSAESPREWDNVGTMVCWHNRYDLGDEHPRMSPEEYLEDLARLANHDKMGRIDDMLHRAVYPSPRYRSLEAMRARYIERTLAENYIILPLYLYDHSGLSMSTSGFSCPWDSGQVGFIFTSMGRARQEWTGTDEEIREQAERCLRGEVETYDQYLTGDVWGYVVARVYYDEDGDEEQRDELDSCWGFFGREYCEQEAEDSATHYRNMDQKVAA